MYVMKGLGCGHRISLGKIALFTVLRRLSVRTKQKCYRTIS